MEQVGFDHPEELSEMTPVKRAVEAALWLHLALKLHEEATMTLTPFAHHASRA